MAKNGDKISIRDLMSGNFLSREGFLNQLPFILYLAFLGLIYITNHFNAEKVLRETQKLEKELHEMRAESITRTSILMDNSKQSKVAERVKERNLGLEEATTPPQQIIVDR